MLAHALNVSATEPGKGLAIVGRGPSARTRCVPKQTNWSASVAKLHRSETDSEVTLRQVEVIQDLIGDLERTVQVLNIDICTEEERVRVFDRSDPGYPILAKTLTARRDNLNHTIAFLARRQHAIMETVPVTVAEAA